MKIDKFLGGGDVGATYISDLASIAQPLAQEDPVALAYDGLAFLWPESLLHLSASSLGMFRRCPEQFRHRYLLGEKERPGESLVIGSAFHKGVEFNYAQKLTSHEDRPVNEVVEYLQDQVVPEVLELNGGASEIAWDSEDAVKGEKTMRLDSERCLVRYHEDVVPRIQPIGLEEQYYLPDPSLPVPLLGYVDLRSGYEGPNIDGTVEWIPDRIIDTKTGKQAKTKLSPSWKLQAALYAAMTSLPVEYHSISRAATPKIVTALESDEMVYLPNEIKTRNVIRSAAQVAKMIGFLYATVGPDETWPTWGAFADWSMSFSPCERCGWRSVCPAVEGEV